jgi:hypothetical protein
MIAIMKMGIVKVATGSVGSPWRPTDLQLFTNPIAVDTMSWMGVTAQKMIDVPESWGKFNLFNARDASDRANLETADGFV